MSLSASIKDSVIIQQIVANPDQIFFIYNIASKRIEYINSALTQVTGKSKENINDELPSFISMVHPDDRQFVAAQVEQVLDGVQRKKFEFRIILNEYSTKWVLAQIYLIEKNKKRHAIAGVVEDITIQKQNEENANTFSIKKNAVLEILAHDLTGPIGIMQNIATLIQAQSEDNPRIQEYSSLIEQICKRNIAMIRDLIHTEYLASSEIELTMERIELVDRTGVFIDNYKRSEDKLAKTFTLTANRDKIFAVVDEIKFSQVINNIVSNAIKFTPDGGSISIHLEEQENHIVISIKDTGIGIPQEVQPFLFDRFTKARRAGLKGEETTGLGMSITKKLVELHNGKIWFDSKENQGTTFFIQIPKATVSQLQ